MAYKKDLIRIIQHFEAVSCIGPSALRGQGAGVIGAVRAYLRAMKLGRIPRRSQRRFQTWLDRHTDGILDSLPVRNRPWGAARKALNLFLRAVTYNHYIRSAYRLRAIERWLEIPVDSVIANALRDEAPGAEELPRWPGLKHLDRDEHTLYQECARRLARVKGLPALIFLDNILWLDNR